MVAILCQTRSPFTSRIRSTGAIVERVSNKEYEQLTQGMEVERYAISFSLVYNTLYKISIALNIHILLYMLHI